MVTPIPFARCFVASILCIGLVLNSLANGAGATTAPTIADRGAATPKAAIDGMVVLMNQNAPTQDWMGFQPPANLPLAQTQLQLAAELGAKAKEVGALVAKKIGKTEAGMITSMAPGIQAGWLLSLQNQLSNVIDDGHADWSKVKINETGDKAQVAIPYDTIPLARVNGKWYVGEDGQHDSLPKDIDGIKDMTDKSMKMLDEVEQEVKSGKLNKKNFMQEYPNIVNENMAGGQK